MIQKLVGVFVVVLLIYLMAFVMMLLVVGLCVIFITACCKWVLELFKNQNLECGVMMTTEAFIDLLEKDPEGALAFMVNDCHRDSFGNNKLHLGSQSQDTIYKLTELVQNHLFSYADDDLFVSIDFDTFGLGNKLYMVDKSAQAFGTERLIFSWDTSRC